MAKLRRRQQVECMVFEFQLRSTPKSSFTAENDPATPIKRAPERHTTANSRLLDKP